MNAKGFMFAIAIILMGGGTVVADEPILPGHALTTQVAQVQADTIFLGKLVSLEPLKDRNSKGEYVGGVIYISRSANGITPARTSQNTTVRTPAIPSDLSIPVRMTVAAGEEAPLVGRSYLFYAKDNKQPGQTGYEALKLAPTSEHGLPSRIF